MNNACLSKHDWKLQNVNGDLWRELVWGEYGCDNNRQSTSMKSIDSTFWINIVRIWPKVEDNNF